MKRLNQKAGPSEPSCDEFLVMRLELFSGLTPEQKAETIVGLATLTDNGPTGCYFRAMRPQERPAGQDVPSRP